MNLRTQSTDPLGRSWSVTVRTLVLATTLLAITGSVWPIQPRSGCPIFDTTNLSSSRAQRFWALRQAR